MTSTLSEIFLEKLNDYKETVVENADLYFKLSKIIQTRTNNNNLEINLGLISRLDDIYEDIVTTNVNLKILKNLIQSNLEITSSTREEERRNRIISLRRNNQITPFWFLLSLLSNDNDTDMLNINNRLDNIDSLSSLNFSNSYGNLENSQRTYGITCYGITNYYGILNFSITNYGITNYGITNNNLFTNSLDITNNINLD